MNPPRRSADDADAARLDSGRGVRIAARRVQVAALLSRGLSTVEIAASTAVSVRTATSDIAAVRKQAAAEVSKLTPMSVAADIVEQAKDRTRELWRLYVAAGRLPNELESIRQRAALLRSLQLNTESTTKLLQALGIVYRAPLAVDLQSRALHILEYRIPADARRDLALATDPSQVRGILTAHVGAEDADLVIKAAAMTAAPPDEA